MARYLDLGSDDRYRGLIQADDDDRSYLFNRQHAPGYRFGRTRGKLARARSAFIRFTGHLKHMIEAIADTKLRRMERGLELRGIRIDRSAGLRATAADRAHPRQGRAIRTAAV